MKEKLFISVRDDGVATRLLSMLNAFYLADKFQTINSMKFFWNSNLVLFDKYYINNDQRNFENSNIIGQSVGPVELIFSDTFIKRHYLNNTNNYTTNIPYLKNYDYPEDTLDLLRFGFNKTYKCFSEEIVDKKNIYVHQHNLSSQLNGIDIDLQYKNKLRELWRYIDFKDNLKQCMQDADKKSKNLGEFTVVHVRSGDVIYTYSNARKFNLEGIYHATALELAMGIIKEQKNDKVIIVGDDITSTQILKRQLKSDNIFHISEFRSEDNLSNLELLLFDLIFMSNSKKIFGTHSALVTLSSIIGFKINMTNNYHVFNKKQQYDIFRQYHKYFDNAHNSQKAFSLFHMYLLGKDINDGYDILRGYLKKALILDPDNDKYRIHLVSLLFRYNKLKLIERYLAIVFKKRKKDFMDTFLSVSWSGYVYRDLFCDYVEFFQNKNYLNINVIAIEIIKLRMFGVYLVKQHLSFKIGNCILQSKSPLQILKLPIKLVDVIVEYQNNKNIIQEIKLKECEDYNAALRIKNYFSYRLGKIIIKGFKNWYKGEVLLIPLKIYNLRKQYKKGK
ncbi:sugar transferase [Campylobacter lari]|uniref:hypothetical protein n=1 Tax=Campylobacter TaxID=194 RepID=UPI00126C03FF|nr:MULTISPECIES: hypothetical protein [Campylobacter]EAI4303027.1 sugar transferase [Campylobacter lari]EAJ0329298.1 sugar transferase [Campylobacter lari]EAJ5678734.1 sugar transferase [Campylobacter lari]EAK0445250.1 sugar transferase [Campylobacter lari]EAK0795032.1 sugar transferase [Campylobacter lari]